MADKTSSTEVTQQKKVFVKSEAVLKEMERQGLLEPFTDYYTPDEDINFDCLRTKVLWTNPNPNASFSAQTVNLTSSDWDYLVITSQNSDTHTRTKSVIFSRSSPSSVGATLNYLSTSSSYGPVNYVRHCNIVTWNGNPSTSYSQVYFENCYQGYNSTEIMDNRSCIPNQIIGIYKSPAMIYTGDELHEGNGIKIDNGVISSDSGYLMLSVPFSSSTIHTIQTELTEGTYDIFITGNASAGTDMYFYVNGDQSATYFWNSYQTYHASSSVTGGGKAWTTSFFMGSMFIYESRYHITLTITKESGVMFNCVGGGIDQSTYYARSVVGSKASVPNYTINSITFGSSNSSVTTAGNIKIYKRY